MEIEFILYWLSWSALITTITLFFTGIPICLNIYKLGGTGDISGMPFLMGLLGGSFWLRYGFLKGDMTMIQVNVVAVTLFFCYCVFYLVYADVKTGFAVKFVTTLSAILGMALWMQFSPNLDALGILCMTFNILTFGAPLAGLGVVLRKKCVESLPLPMCCFNLMVSSQWFLYGTLLQDKYIMIPNSVGMILAVLQLSLFIIFPCKMHGRSPLQMICGNSHHKSASCEDFEKEPMNLENETNSPIVGEPSVASTDDSQNSPSLYRQHSDARLEKRLSSGFVEGSGAEQQHSPQMRSRSNSVPEMKIPIV